MAVVEAASNVELWTPEAVKAAYVEALIVIERTVPGDGPALARSNYGAIYTADDIAGQADRYGLDSRVKDRRGRAQHIIMPQRGNKVRVRYTPEQIEWATFVLCGGSFHGSAKVGPWTSGIIANSVTRESFEAWGRQVAGRRLGSEKRTMKEIAASAGLPPRTFHRYVLGAAEQIAKSLNAARVDRV
ncbi:hypothetical protein [Devosia lacusdianchii]|uniref:hypothetical protein n=1 Tax=Devosia lacusdianchii TaxID=2917991 RepID=UPI001F05C187|nr:hypothetical protein [Devosia sp. JXJ CY 41]